MRAATHQASLAFGSLNAHRISVQCDTRNIAATKMLEKSGLRRDAEWIKGEFPKGEWVSTYRYALPGEECVAAC
jgi:RimJ/RimL family protein N-acetyltransferase